MKRKFSIASFVSSLCLPGRKIEKREKNLYYVPFGDKRDPSGYIPLLRPSLANTITYTMPGEIEVVVMLAFHRASGTRSPLSAIGPRLPRQPLRFPSPARSTRIGSRTVAGGPGGPGGGIAWNERILSSTDRTIYLKIGACSIHIYIYRCSMEKPVGESREQCSIEEGGRHVWWGPMWISSRKGRLFWHRRFFSLIRSPRRRLPPAVAPAVKASNQLLGAPLGTNVTLKCYVEAFPKTINYWMKDGKEMLLDGWEWFIVLFFFIQRIFTNSIIMLCNTSARKRTLAESWEAGCKSRIEQCGDTGGEAESVARSTRYCDFFVLHNRRRQVAFEHPMTLNTFCDKAPLFLSVKCGNKIRMRWSFSHSCEK